MTNHSMKVDGLSTELQPQAPQFSVRDVLFVVFRRKWVALSFLMVFGGLGYLATSMVPLVFESKTIVFLKPSRELETLDPANPDSRAGIASHDLMRSEMAILDSKALAEFIVSRVGPEMVLQPYLAHVPDSTAPGATVESVLNVIVPPSASTSRPAGSTAETQSESPLWNRAVGSVMGNFSAESRETLISLSYRGPGPKYCQTMLEASLNAYKARRVEVYSVSPDSFEQQTKNVQKELEMAEQELQQYLAKIGIISFEDERSLLVSQLGHLRAELTSSEIIISSSESRIAGAKHLAELRQEGIIVDNSESGFDYQMNQNLSDLLLQEADLSTRYPSHALPLRNLREQIAQLQEAILLRGSGDRQESSSISHGSAESRFGSFGGIELVVAKTELDSEIARRKSLQEAIAECTEKLAALEPHELPIKRLQRRLDTLERSYVAHLANLEKAKVNAELDNQLISNFSIIQSPTLPLGPDTRLRTRILAFSLFFAFFGSLGFPFLLNILDHSLKTAEEVERNLGLPVLATFPRSKHHKLQLVSTDKAKPRPKPIVGRILTEEETTLRDVRG